MYLLKQNSNQLMRDWPSFAQNSECRIDDANSASFFVGETFEALAKVVTLNSDADLSSAVADNDNKAFNGKSFPFVLKE